ncbi:energy transducer TonB [Roseicella frigidaeris]|uniref:TonB C-terminal domain-containing protein n=1 Tax=Roseicella frigidaeris TaxID=2230885 RepID=A0A327M8J4_9PROT|nr:energy transducer TonB [Roseicella frigidaeris]RAI59039.1 hypothetical protein DOO78_10910 [Roseicella frigidaeris]
MRPGLAASLLLHAGFATLVILAALMRPKPAEPPSPLTYDLVYREGEVGQEEPPAPQGQPVPPAPPAPTQPPTPPNRAEIPRPVAPPPPTAPPQPQAPPAPPPANARLAAPSPAPAPAPPAPSPLAEALPLPPPAPPAPQPQPPQQEAAVIAPPRPARPQTDRLPGLWLPDAARLMPSPRQQEATRRPLDLSLGSLAAIGRADRTAPQVSVRGAQVGSDWMRAFQRWAEENIRYPQSAAVVGDQGVNRIQVLVAADGRVKSWRLVRRSGSVWLDAGLEGPFRNAVLPAFPGPVDPEGAVVDLTVNWHIIRQ